MIYIGIDPGVKPVFAILEDDGRVFFQKIVTRRYDLIEKFSKPLFPGLHEYLRIQDLSRKFDRRIDRWQTIMSIHTDFIFGLEGLAFGASHRVALMSKVDYALKCGILQRGYNLIQVAPGTWKKFVGGSGRASKELVKQCLVHAGYVELLDKPMDYSDALAIALTTRSIHEQNTVNGYK